MKTLITHFVLIALVLLAGCASNPSLEYQFATMRLVEDGRVEPEQVVQRVETVRGALKGAEAIEDLTFQRFVEEVKEVTDFDELRPSTQLVVNSIIQDTRTDLDIKHHTLLDDEYREAINQRLDWISQAAMM